MPKAPTIIVATLASFAVWALSTGWTPEIHYERVTWGMFAAWLVSVRIWSRLRGRAFQTCGFFCTWLGDLLFSLSPGGFLVWYGASAPQVPSYTRGGMDICDLEPGFCVSGTRAFIGFGIELLVVGFVIAGALYFAKPPPKRSDQS